MTDWTIVLWNDARQIAQHAKIDKDSWPDEAIAPQTHFETLRQNGEDSLATLFIASALPRLEAITWVANVLPQADKTHPDFRDRRQLRDMIQRWVDDPDDKNRRAIFDIAEESDPEWPETLLGLAVYFSGGSIAPPDLDPVLPNPEIAAHLAAATLQIAAVENLKTDENFLNRALDLAHNVAVKGQDSLRAG